MWSWPRVAPPVCAHAHAHSPLCCLSLRTHSILCCEDMYRAHTCTPNMHCKGLVTATCPYTSMHTHTYTRTCTCTQTSAHTHIHTHKHSHTHTNTHTHTHTYTHTHVSHPHTLVFEASSLGSTPLACCSTDRASAGTRGNTEAPLREISLHSAMRNADVHVRGWTTNTHNTSLRCARSGKAPQKLLDDIMYDTYT